VIAANLAAPGLYKTTDSGETFTQIWNGGGNSCAPFGGPCITSWGIDRIQMDPDDPAIIYAAATDVGIWRSWQADNGGAFTQIFFSQNQANVGSDRTDFALTKLPSGKTRIYAATGATGAFAGFPAPETAPSQVWRIDDAKRPAATLIAEETLVVPGGQPPAPGGWKNLTSSVVGDPGYATYNFCTGQCWYDIGVYTPANRPTRLSSLDLILTERLTVSPMPAPFSAPPLLVSPTPTTTTSRSLTSRSTHKRPIQPVPTTCR